MSRLPLSKLVMLPLAGSVICAGCMVISNAAGETCPACGGGGLASLSRILNRVDEDEDGNRMPHGVMGVA